jgi:hypothetical protein
MRRREVLWVLRHVALWLRRNLLRDNALRWRHVVARQA